MYLYMKKINFLRILNKMYRHSLLQIIRLFHVENDENKIIKAQMKLSMLFLQSFDVAKGRHAAIKRE